MTVTSMAVDLAGTLNIRCDDAADNITVYQSGASTMVRNITPSGATTVSNMGTGVKFLDVRTFGGNDTVNNNTGIRASIWGGSDDDTLNGGSNIDSIYGEMGKDTLNGNNSGDYLYGGPGNDTIRGGSGADYIEGDDYNTNNISIFTEPILPYTNNDTINGGAGTDEIYGQIGNDVIQGGGGSDKIWGGRGIDYLYGDDIAQSYYVTEDKQNSGNDKLYGGDDGDTLYGGYGSDTLYGGYGQDSLWGGNNNDILFGESDNDYVDGQGGDDFLDSGAASEAVYDSSGNDFNAYVTVVNGSKANDISQGGSENCFMLASMSAAAARGVDFGSLITYVGNGVYSVALYKISPATGRLTPTNVTVNFDGTLKVTDPMAHYRGQEGESWTVIVNRALATLLNVDLVTTDGDYAGTVLAAIMGRDPQTTAWTDNVGYVSPFYRDSLLDYLYNVGNAVPTVVGTRDTAAELGSNLFAQNHVYAVHSVQITGYVYSPSTYQYVPQYSIVLYNPWGTDTDVGSFRGDNSDGFLTISGSEFKRNFDEITFA